MEEGIKYDTDKPRLAEMLVDFKEPLLALCKVWEFGANKYKKSNWKLVKDGETRYTNALLRHLFAEEDNPVDDESLLLHASHIAFNALARLYFILQNRTANETLSNHEVVSWKDHIADFYECAPQGLYNLEPGAINEEVDEKVRVSYLTKYNKEREDE